MLVDLKKNVIVMSHTVLRTCLISYYNNTHSIFVLHSINQFNHIFNKSKEKNEEKNTIYRNFCGYFFLLSNPNPIKCDDDDHHHQ